MRHWRLMALAGLVRHASMLIAGVFCKGGGESQSEPRMFVRNADFDCTISVRYGVQSSLVLRYRYCTCTFHRLFGQTCGLLIRWKSPGAMEICGSTATPRADSVGSWPQSQARGFPPLLLTCRMWQPSPACECSQVEGNMGSSGSQAAGCKGMHGPRR